MLQSFSSWIKITKTRRNTRKCSPITITKISIFVFSSDNNMNNWTRTYWLASYIIYRVGNCVSYTIYTWGRWTILVKIPVKLWEQQTFTYSFGVSSRHQIITFYFWKQKVKKKKEKRKGEKKKWDAIPSQWFYYFLSNMRYQDILWTTHSLSSD